MRLTRSHTICATICIVAAGLLMPVTPLLAHHSFAAEYDSTKPVTLQGKFTKMDWVNPHSWIHMEAMNPATGKSGDMGHRDRASQHPLPQRLAQGRHQGRRRDRGGRDAGEERLEHGERANGEDAGRQARCWPAPPKAITLARPQPNEAQSGVPNSR